jgi:hypothetical protein
MNDRDSNGESNDAMPAVVRSAVARLAPPAMTTSDQVAQVMGAVRRRHADIRRRRSMLLSGAIAATLLIGISIVWRPSGSAAPQRMNAMGERSVQFALVAPRARQLALVGDFNSWNSHATPMTRDPATGAWVTNVRLAEGRYLYAFVADGKAWIADPHAPLASADDFAHPNSVIVVNTQIASATAR